MAKFTHSVMKHSLAKALMDASVEHFDAGGPVLAGQGTPGGGGLIGGIAGGITVQNGYQAGLAPTQNTDYAPTIDTAGSQALSGFGNSQGIQAQQQSLANALLAQSQGQGPNPAQAALNQNTGNNIAAQGALMASQRGAGGNVGLMARQAAMQGGALQQGAVGQAATLQAQQQIAAQQQLAAQQAEMQRANLGEQGLNANMYGAAAGAQNAQNNTGVANYGMMQGINAKSAAANAEATNKTAGGIWGGIGSLLSGGMLSKLGGGGGGGGSMTPTGDPTMMAGEPSMAGAGDMAMMVASKGGEVPSHLHKMASIYHPEFAKGATDFRTGGPVPGKAQVKGDSRKNDTVPAMLSPGEEVLPRSVTQSANAPEKAAEFVRHLQDKKAVKKSGYADIAQSKKTLKQRIEHLEKLSMGGYAG